MTQEIKKVKTREELIKWQEEIYELEKDASAGVMSEEEQERRVNNLLDKNYFHRRLEELRAHKQKLLEDLAWVEEREQLLLAEIDRREQTAPTTNSQHV
ncbi:hypothetical protein RIVM261_062820 [Rivularia sp. IAM M-261]|nr:hypothetical protein CAL7716_049040 [Calothrix sp. PCC 7716]GJD21326.1 hypothetical protein RIVM261_062820 [Rivularia sp. IAM M-261]